VGDCVLDPPTFPCEDGLAKGPGFHQGDAKPFNVIVLFLRQGYIYIYPPKHRLEFVTGYPPHCAYHVPHTPSLSKRLEVGTAWPIPRYDVDQIGILSFDLA